MTTAGRGQAIYDKIATSANFGKMNQAEKDALRAQLILIWGDGDLTYIKANAEVLPNTFTTPSGATVATTGSAAAQTGTVTTPTALSGKGAVT